MAEPTAIADRVRELLAQVLGVASATIGPDFSATTSPSWTSLNHLMLMSQLEGEFGVVFSNQEIRDLLSYSAIVDTVGRRLSGA